MAGESGFEVFSAESSFSPRHAAPFDIQGKTFCSVLQCLMYRKAELFKDKEQMFNIMATHDLKQIEHFGQIVRMVDTHTWNKERVIWLELALEEKFSQNPDLKKSLFATFPRTLVYATTKDRFWSIGLSDKNPKALSMKDWKGLNLFGEALTKIRDKLMKMNNWLQDGSEGKDKRVKERDETRQGDGGNRHGVGGQSTRDTKRQGGEGNRHEVERQADGDEGRHRDGLNRHGGEIHPPLDERMKVEGESNSHELDQQAGRDSMEQNGRWESQTTEEQASGDYKVQGGEAKNQGIKEHASKGKNSQGGNGLEGQTTRGSKRKGGKRKNQRADGHKAIGSRQEGCGGEGEKRHKGLEEERLTGEENKESDRISDWQKVSDEMPHWDATEITSRLKRKETNEQTQQDWNKHGRKNTGSRNTKGFYKEMPNQDKFVLFFGNQSPFSQHHPVKFVIDGTEFNCAEQYMMYQKTVIFDNKEMERKIMGTSNPVEQKRYGRQIPEFKFEVWKKHFIDVVERATEAKFTQNPHLQGPLFATYPKLLVEASPSDRLWGIGRSEKDPLAWDRETWRGKNQLGYIITRVRDRLMKKEDTHWAEWEKWKDDKRWEEMEKEEKMKKRKWEHSNLDIGNTKERNPKTRRERDNVRDDMVTLKEDRPMYLSRRESYKHVSGKDNFEFFGGIKSPFNQHYPARFTVDGLTFASAEQFTLYQMAVIFEDQECQKNIMSTNDPKALEDYSYEIPNFQWEVWEPKCVQIVERGITAKFTQNSDLKELLFATSPKLLAECKYDDLFWSIGYGLGFARKNSNAWNTKFWRGDNVLGYTLTHVRDRLMEKEQAQKEVGMGDMKPQSTTEGGEDDTLILGTMKELAVGGDDKQNVKTMKDETNAVNVEIPRNVEDVEDDERGSCGKQDVRENWDDEMEDVTSTECEVRENKDVSESVSGGERRVVDHQQEAKDSLGEEVRLEYAPVEGEDDGTQEVVTRLDSTEVGEENRVEQEKVEKDDREELLTREESTPLEDHESSPKENDKEADEKTDDGEMERLENGVEKSRLVVCDAEDKNDAAVKGIKEGDTKIEEYLHGETKLAEPVTKSGEDNREVAETGIVEDRKEGDGRAAVAHQGNVGEKMTVAEEASEKVQEVEGKESDGPMQDVKATEYAKSGLDIVKKESHGGRRMQERGEKESNVTMQYVKATEVVMSAPDTSKEDVKGGRRIQEDEEKESNDTVQEVEATEDVPYVPEASKEDVKGGRRIQEEEEKESNDTVQEVELTEDVPSAPDASKEDVKGGRRIQEEEEKESSDTVKEVEATEDVPSVPDASKEDVKGGRRIQEEEEKESIDTVKEVEATEDVPSVPDASKEDVKGGRRIQEQEEKESSDTVKEVEATEDVPYVPDASKEDVKGGRRIQEDEEKESNDTMQEVEATEDVPSAPDASKEDVKGGRRIQEEEEKESIDTVKEVEATEDVPSVPDASKEDVKGGRRIQEQEEKESSDTVKEVEATEDVPYVPDASKEDVKGGRRIQEDEEKESNDTVKEVEATEDVPYVPDASKEDVKGGRRIQEDEEKESNDTMQEVEATEDVPYVPDASKEDVKGGRRIQEEEEKESIDTVKEVEATEDVPSVPDASKEDVKGGRRIQEQEEKESSDTVKEVEATEDVPYVPDASKEDVKGGRRIQEDEEKESNDTMQEVEATEDVPSAPDASKKDVKGGRRIQEEEEKESNDTVQEVELTEDVPSAPDASKEDVKGGRRIQEEEEKESSDTVQEVEATEDVPSAPDASKEDVKGGRRIQEEEEKESIDTVKEVEATEDVPSVPDASKEDVKGGRRIQEQEEKESSDTVKEVEATEDVPYVPDASKEDVKGGRRIQEDEEKESNDTMQEVEATEDVPYVPDASKEDVKGGRRIQEEEEKESIDTVKEVEATEDVPSVPDASKEDVKGGRRIQEQEEKESSDTVKEVEATEDVPYVPDASKEDVKGGRRIQEDEEKESNDTMQEVEATEDVPSAPDASKKDVKGGRRIQEEEEKESNDTVQEVELTEDVPSAPDASKEDVKGGRRIQEEEEKESSDTVKEVEATEDVPSVPDASKEDVKGGRRIQEDEEKESNDTMQEVEATEDVPSAPDASKKDVKGGRRIQEEEEKESSDTVKEVEATEDVPSVPDASKEDVKGGRRIQEDEEKESIDTVKEVEATEDVPSVPDASKEDVKGGRRIQEDEEKESIDTVKEVEATEDVPSVPDASKEDVKGGRRIQEDEEKESIDTVKEVEATEDVPSAPDASKKDVKGGRRIQEDEEKESNDTVQEVEATEDVPSAPDVSKKDVKGGRRIQEQEEKESSDTVKEVEATEDVPYVPEASKKDVKGGRRIQEQEEKESNDTVQEVEATEDVQSAPDVSKEDVKGAGRVQWGEEKEGNCSVQEVKATEDAASPPDNLKEGVKGRRTTQKAEEKESLSNGTMHKVGATGDVTSVPDTSKEDDDGGRTIQVVEEKEGNGTMQEVKATENLTSVSDDSKEDFEGGRTIHKNDKKQVIKGEDDNVEKEPTPAEEDIVATSHCDNWQEDVRRVTLQQEAMGAVGDDSTPETPGEEVVLEGKEAGEDGMEQEKTDKVNSEQAAVVGHDIDPQADEVQEVKDAPKGEVTDMATEIVVPEKVQGRFQQSFVEQNEFRFFSGNDSPFSLQYKADFEIDGKQFISAEHYITYQQAVLSEDEACAKKILSASDHEKMKDCGKGIQNFNQEAWQENMETVLERAIEAKFDQNPKLHASLFETHPKILVEASPGNKKWGIGLASTDVRAQDKSTWKGSNLLGYALTRLRDKLMKQPRRHPAEAKKHVAAEKEGEATADSENTKSKTAKKKKKKKKAHKAEEGAGDAERQREGAVGDEEAEDGDVHPKRKWFSEKQDQNNKKRENEPMGKGDCNSRSPVGNKENEPKGPRLTREITPTKTCSNESTNGVHFNPTYRDKRYEGLSGQDQLFLFYGHKSPFSHHHPARFVIDGVKFNCGEQYMMYRKAVTFNDKDIERKVMATDNPAEHKRLGRMIPNFDIRVWKQCCQQVVERANMAKFSQNPYLKKKLFKTHPKLMVEASPSDFVWGIGLDREDPLAWDMQNWKGKNQLGYILTYVRDKLMEEENYQIRIACCKIDVKGRSLLAVISMAETKPVKIPESKANLKRKLVDAPPVPEKKQRKNDNKTNDTLSKGGLSQSHRHINGRENFEFFYGNKSPFSQHYPATFTIEGVTFNCAEQYMMYQKAVLFKDEEYKKKIMSTSNPKEQKRLGRKVRNFDKKVWGQNCVGIVERANTAKFSQNQDLKKQLLATSPKLMVECSPRDRLWGIGLGRSNPKAWDTKTWRGKNLLGYALTAVRSRLEKRHGDEDGGAEMVEENKRTAEIDEEGTQVEEKNVDGKKGKDRSKVMSSHKRKRENEDVEVGPAKRRRNESHLQARSPYRHNFHRGDRFPGGQSQKYELFFGWKSPFSQHHPVKFIVEGKEFNCAEQYYMYRKAALFEDKDIEEKIMNSKDPKEQKRLGKQIRNFDFDTWMQHSKEVVEKGNMAKFSQNPHLKKQLFATAPRLMVEASPHDATWGIALPRNDPRAWDERTWRGQNLLGQIITKVRDNLMRQDGVQVDKAGGSMEKTDCSSTVADSSDEYQCTSYNMDRRRLRWQDFSQGMSSGHRPSSSGHLNNPWQWSQKTNRDQSGGERTNRHKKKKKKKRNNKNEHFPRHDRPRNMDYETQTDYRGHYNRGHSDRGWKGRRVFTELENNCPKIGQQSKLMSRRKRKWDCEYVEVNPLKRRRSESYLQTGSPCRHNFHRGDRFPGRQSERYELFFGWQSPFSQHHPVKFTVDGKEFNCAEQYYMYRKAALFEDKDIEEKIMNSRDPKEQKRLGKQIQNFDFDTWMQHSKEVVEKGNMAKFSQNPHLKKKLFATAPRLMVEASPHDATWGIALHRNDPRAWDEQTWQGQNLLGQIITKVRDNLMRQEGHLDDKECNSDGSTRGSPVRYQQKTDSQSSSSRRDSSSLSTQRCSVSEEQKMDLRGDGCRRDSERDSDCGWSKSPARKKHRTDEQDSYNIRDNEILVETEKERKCERRRKMESRRSQERSLQNTDSKETDNDSDSNSSSENRGTGSRSVMCHSSRSEKHSKETKKKKSRKVGQKKKERRSSSEASLDRHDTRRKHSDSSSSSKSEDLRGMDRMNKTAELRIQGEGKSVDGEDSEMVSGRGGRQGDTERTSIDNDKNDWCMHLKVIFEGNGSGELGGQQRKSCDTEDGKRLSSSVQHSKHGETRPGSEGQIGNTQRKDDRDLEMLQDDTVTEKHLHGGEHDIDVEALETDRKMRKENSERRESKKEAQGEIGKAEKEGEAEKGESEDVFPTTVETEIADIPHTEHVLWDKKDTENTIAGKGSDRSDDESMKVSRDEADDDESGQENMKFITDHKMAAVGGGTEGASGRAEDKRSHAESQMVHIKPFKKSAQRHYRDNRKVSDTDSGEMDAGSRRSRKNINSRNRQRHKTGDRMGRSSVDRGSRGVSSRAKYIDNVFRSNKDLFERTTRDRSETWHAIRRDSIDCERSRKRKRDISRNSGNSSDDRTFHWKHSETSKKDKDMPRKDRTTAEHNMVRNNSETSKKDKDMPRKDRTIAEHNMVRNNSETSKKDKDIPSKDGEAFEDTDKDSRKAIGGVDSDARESESPKEHKLKKQNKDNCTSKVQKKKKKKKKAQEINEKRKKKKAQRKEMRKQRKALQRERSRNGGQGHNDKGEG
ncbi:uncharacterized protein [Haliotis asinina]|uniref:uncharacterized protein n=1 Tax=Haliotis asinina TaxID=109174 RepID=UPI00353201EF